MKTVVMMSGGLDSVITAAWLKSKNVDLHAIFFDYGQRAACQELNAFMYFVKALHIRIYKIITLPLVKRLLHSSTWEVQYFDRELLLDKKRSVEIAQMDFMPYRNLFFAVSGALYAESIDADTLAFGFNAESTLESCPDATPKFLKALEEVFKLSVTTKKPLKVEAPLIHLKKHEILQLGRQLGVPFERTYSCFRGGELHCGCCEGCIKRQDSFIRAGIPDLTKYKR